MAEGLTGSGKEGGPVEALLQEIDDALTAFADSNHITIAKDYHNLPNRRLEWGRDIRKLIEISLEDEENLTFSFWICAWQDRGTDRYWKNTYLKRGVPFSEIKNGLQQLLKAAKNLLESCRVEDLEFATSLPW